MEAYLNLAEDSKTKKGREKIVKELTMYGINTHLRERDNECWKMYNNTGDDKEFSFLTKVGEFALPAKIRRIPIQRTKANILLSQQSLRNTKYGIKMIDRSGVSGKLTRTYQSMMMMYANILNQKYRQIELQLKQLDQQVQQMMQILQQEPQDAETAQEQAQIREALPQIEYQTSLVKDNLNQALSMTKEERDKFMLKFKDEYKDLYEVYSHKLFTKVRQELETDRISLKNFRNKLVTGRQFYYVNYSHRLGELLYKTQNPYTVYYPNIEDIEWTQNLPWIVVESWMTKEQIRKNFVMTASQIKVLDNMSYTASNNQGAFVTGPGNVVVLDEQRDDTQAGGASRKWQQTGHGISVKMIWWRADWKIQAIQSPSKYGGKHTMFVDDKELLDTQQNEYNASKGTYRDKDTGVRTKAKNVKTYNSAKGQTKEIRYYDKRFFGINIGSTIVLEGEDPCQPHPQDNYGYTPLPIVGKTFNGIGEYPYSTIWATAELQKQYWIVMYHRELTFALAGASGVVFDLSQKPDGMTKEEWFYHMKLGRYLIQTISKTGARKNTGYNQFSKVDQTLTQSIQYFELILQGIEQQIGALMGVPRQRMGEVQPSDQVGTFDQSNRQAMMVTEILFAEHDEVEVKALELLLNLAIQYRYKPDDIVDVTEEEAELIRIPWDLPDRKFAMKLLNSSKQDVDLDEIKRMSAQMTANGNLPFEFLFKIFSIDSIKEMEGLVAEQSQKQQEIAALQQQGTVEAEAAAEQKKIQMEQQFEQQMQGMQAKLTEAQMKINAALKQRELDIKDREVDIKAQQAAQDGAVGTQEKAIKLQQEDRKQTETERSNKADELIKQTEIQLEAMLSASAGKDISLGSN